MRRTLRLLALALPLVAVACLGEDPVSPPPDIEAITFAPALGVDIANSTETSSGLWYRDIVVGEGAVPLTQDTLSLDHKGYLVDGTEFSAGPFRVLHNANTLIAGFNEGLQTMRPGGRRQLIIPPHLAYGNFGSGPIPPNAVIVFDVTLKSVEPADPE